MNKRRSLTAALDMTPEAEAFIMHGLPKDEPKREPRKTESGGEPRSPSQANERTIETAPQPESKPKPESKPRLKKEREAAPKAAPEPVGLTTAVVSITTRYRQPTAEALRRASLERKLKGVVPNTQQEIVEAAVGAWLKESGYLK